MDLPARYDDDLHAWALYQATVLRRLKSSARAEHGLARDEPPGLPPGMPFTLEELLDGDAEPGVLSARLATAMEG